VITVAVGAGACGGAGAVGTIARGEWRSWRYHRSWVVGRRHRRARPSGEPSAPAEV